MEVRVEYDYIAEQSDELTIHKGDIITNVQREEEGWMRGQFRGKEGLFPDNFVKVIVDSAAVVNNPPLPVSKNVTDVSNRVNRMGVGLGDIFSGNKLELKKPGRLILDDKNNLASNGTTSATVTPTSEAAESLRSTSSSAMAPASAAASHVDRVRVKYAYTASNPDELTMEVGDIVTVISRNVEDEGWWRGELRGKTGVFPDNFVEELAESKAVARSPLQNASGAAKTTPSGSGGNASALFAADNQKSLSLKKNNGPPPTPASKPKPGGIGVSTSGSAINNNVASSPVSAAASSSSIALPTEDFNLLRNLNANRPRQQPKRPPSKSSLLSSTQDEDGYYSEPENDKPSAQVNSGRTTTDCGSNAPLKRGVQDGPATIGAHEASNTAAASRLVNVEKGPGKVPAPAPAPSTPTQPSTVKSHVDPPARPPQISPQSNRAHATESTSLGAASPSAAAAAVGNAAEMLELRREVTRLRAECAAKSALDELATEFRSELRLLKTRVHQLMNEVDAEKKLRLAATVELERMRTLMTERDLSSC